MREHQIGYDFIQAGNATFTVQLSDTEWYTYKVRVKEGLNGGDPVHFISLLTGPDNMGDFNYLGMLSPETGSVRLTRASRFSEDSRPVKVVRRAIARLRSGEAFPEGTGVFHEGRCGRCGRKLTVPESIATGFGPECAGRNAQSPVHPERKAAA